MLKLLHKDSKLKMESIHFTTMPSHSDSLIDSDAINTIKRMQSAIETGRLIRDKESISLKYPVRKIKLVDADSVVL